MDRQYQSPAHHPNINDPNAFVFYRYDPSLVAAIVSVLCFFISTSVHIFQATKYRAYYFIPFILGGIFDTIGYIGRALAHYHQYDLSIYIMQSILLLLAPALFAATIYMILGRIIQFTGGEKMAPVPAKWLTKIFVCGDIVMLSVQGVGGGLMATIEMKVGEHLVVAGLLLQITCFGIFIITSGIFHYRMVRSPTAASIQAKWQKCLYTLYSASSLILVRSIFRVVEFLQGNDSVLMRHEVLLYVFDGVMMFGVMVSFNIVYSGKVIGRRQVEDSMVLTGVDSMAADSIKYWTDDEKR